MDDLTLAETSVLGSVLIDPRCAQKVVTALHPEDFNDSTRQAIFTAVRDLYLEQKPIDPVTVLNRMGTPDKATRQYLLKTMEMTPTACNVDAYIPIVQEKAKLRRIQGAAMNIISTDATLATAQENVAQMQALFSRRNGIECMSMEEGLLAFYDELEHTPKYLPWGLDFLNQGLTAESGDYIVLGGYPSDGKTALALAMAYAQSETMKVGFFSLETKNSKLFSRIISNVARVKSSRIKHRKLDSEDHQKLADISETVTRHKLELIRASSMTVEDIAAYSIAKGYDVIWIDYLTLIPAPGKSEYDQTTYISKALHRLAQDNNITVVALSQLSRPEKGKPQPPTLASLRASGQIEQDADVVLFIYREHPGELRSRRILRVAKNKEGATGQLILNFDGETQTFTPDTHAAIQEAAKEARTEEPALKQVSLYALPDSLPLPEEWQDKPAAGAEGKGV